MSVTLLNLKTIRILTLAGLASLFVGCKSNGGNSESDDTISVDNEALQKEKILKDAKKVMLSLPSPIETAMLIKRAGAKFNEELLNPTSNAANYTSNKSMSIAMGVYGADLSYASIFDQTQTVMKYMATSKKIADALGLLSSIDQNIIKRMESNVNDRDSIIRIISETFMNSNSSLKEDNRPALAALILTGGWIEGLYIATSVTKSSKDKELIERIVDQRLSFNDMTKLLEQNSDNPDCAQVLASLAPVKAAFDAIKVQTSNIVPVTDKDSKITTFKATSKITITEEQFKKLKDETLKLRTAIIK
jgi:murein L,D-transpeptidase YcbB/YkuD